MSTKGGQVRLEWKYADDFKRVYATNSFNILAEYDTRIVFGLSNVILQSDATSMPKGVGEYKVEIILPFRALKELAISLSSMVKEAETRFGEIKLQKRPEDYFKQP
jgi:hypothetical protein